MPDPGAQTRVNTQVWERGSYVGDYANRRLLPVEVLLLVRYREALSRRVLELGSGAGRILGYLVALGGEVHGIDISEAMVAHSRAAYPTADVRVGDVGSVAATVDGKFTAVLAMDNVLDIFSNGERRRVLGELKELLEPDGLLVFSSHNLAYRGGDSQGALQGGANGGLARVRELVWKAGSRPVADVARVALRMPQRILNRRRLSPLQHREADHAIINDEAHDYGLLHYYIRRDDQERQLSALGYELIECLDVEGRAVSAGVLSPSPWLHYIALPAAREPLAPDKSGTSN